MPPKRIGDYLIQLEYVTPKQIDDAFEAQKRGEFPDLRIGDILIAQNIIDRAKLDKAIELQMIDMYAEE